LSVEAASLRLPRRVEFVQMPAEPADQPGSLLVYVPLLILGLIVVSGWPSLRW
jgi:hypothetical protein